MIREEKIQLESHRALDEEPIPDNNYIAFEKGFCIGAKWADKTMIDKASEWLENNLITVVTDDYIYTASVHNISRGEFIEQFKKAIEEQL